MSDTKTKNTYLGLKPLQLEINEVDKFNFQEKAENIFDLIIRPFFREKQAEINKIKAEIKPNEENKEEIIKKFVANNYFTKHNTLLINGPTGSGKTTLIHYLQNYIKTGLSHDKINPEFNSTSAGSTTTNFLYKFKKDVNEKILKNIDKFFSLSNSTKKINKLKTDNEPGPIGFSISSVTYNLTDFNFYKDYHANLLVSLFEKLGNHSIIDKTLKFIDKYLLDSIDELINEVVKKATGKEGFKPLEKVKSLLFNTDQNQYNEVSYAKVKRVSHYINLLTLEKPLVVILDGLDTFKPKDMEKIFYILDHIFSNIPNIFFIIPCNYDYVSTVLQINKAKTNYITNLFSFKINTAHLLKSEDLCNSQNQFINKLILTTNNLNLGMFNKTALITQRTIKNYQNEFKIIDNEKIQLIFFFLALIKYNHEDWYLNILKLSELDFLLIDNLTDKLLDLWEKELTNEEYSNQNLDLIKQENTKNNIFEAILSSLVNQEDENINITIKTEIGNYKSLFYFYLLLLSNACKLKPQDYEIKKIANHVEIKIKKHFFMKKPNFINFNFTIFQELIKELIFTKEEDLTLEMINSIMQTSIYTL